MKNNVILRNFLVFALIGGLFSVNCYGQSLSISYNTPNSFTAGIAICALNPTVKGGTVNSYSIKPGLPDDLKLDTISGIISGKPKKPSPETEYSIIAIYKTAPGKTSTSNPFKIKITVCPAASTVNPCASKEDAKTDCCKINSNHRVEGWELVLVFMPVLFFIVFLALFLIYINFTTEGKEFSLKEALSESSYPQITVENPQYSTLDLNQLIDLQKTSVTPTASATNIFFPTTITKTDNKYRSSMSRLIAFLTTMLSLIIGLGLSSFFIYSYLKNGCVPDISKLSAVLISMGIGVAPYVSNKLSNIGGGGSGK
ncbi:MAG: pknD 4 [Mucilaginibacter sp.]|nr:pknD 4 [Mucilaginibacter sp.]